MTTAAPVAVIFDFDGTLADTEWPIYERARAAASGLGADLTPELWATHAVGASRHEPWWDDLAPLLGLTIDQAAFDEAVEAVTDIPRALDSAAIAAGASDLIAALAAEGTTLAVASGSSRDWVAHHLARFELTHLLPILVGRDHPEVTAGKPAPDLYRVAVAALAVDPALVVAVEDTTRGIDSARAAGLGAVVAVPTRLTSHQDLSSADLVTDSLADLTPADLATLVR
ncbi:MAG: HAD family hydrolase [Iamia sp.]